MERLRVKPPPGVGDAPAAPAAVALMAIVREREDEADGVLGVADALMDGDVVTESAVRCGERSAADEASESVDGWRVVNARVGASGSTSSDELSIVFRLAVDISCSTQRTSRMRGAGVGVVLRNGAAAAPARPEQRRCPRPPAPPTCAARESLVHRPHTAMHACITGRCGAKQVSAQARAATAVGSSGRGGAAGWRTHRAHDVGEDDDAPGLEHAVHLLEDLSLVLRVAQRLLAPDHVEACSPLGGEPRVEVAEHGVHKVLEAGASRLGHVVRILVAAEVEAGDVTPKALGEVPSGGAFAATEVEHAHGAAHAEAEAGAPARGMAGIGAQRGSG